MRTIGIIGTTLAACTLAACSATTVSGPASDPAAASARASITSPLTGLPQNEPAQVLIVKLDNTRNAQPHAGLKYADVVYIEEVEYGITRLAAVFASTIPDRVGPVRSARITDIDLTAQYGNPAFAFSGVQSKMWPAISASTVVDVSPNKNASPYSRDFNRRAPYNMFLDGPQVLDTAKGVSQDRSVGFAFAAQAPAGGRPNTGATMKWGGSTAEFAYVPKTGLYRVGLNGDQALAEEDSKGQAAATVVIQYVRQSQSKYWDKGGGNTPHARTIGKGRAIVLRDGQSYDVTWSRPTADAGTTFTMADGSAMPFKPGQQWVVLLNKETPATVLPRPAPAPSASMAKPVQA